MRSTYLFVLLYLTSLIGFAQEGSILQSIEDLVTEIQLEQEDEELDIGSHVERLTFYLQNPLDLNLADDDALRSLQMLNEFQIYSLQRYKKEHGPLASIYELSMIYGFNPDLARSMAPYVITGSRGKYKESIARAIKRSQHQVLARTSRIIELQEGFRLANRYQGNDRAPVTTYRGDPYKQYLRYSMQSTRLSMGITAEKDPGEMFFGKDNPAGFDYYSFHLMLENTGVMKKLVVGDYLFQSGQGLLCWKGYTPSKSALTTRIGRQGTGISKYTGVDENRFFRGIAATFSRKSLSLSLYISRKPIDARLQPTDSQLPGDRVFTSFQTTGSHATYTEMQYKHAVMEQVQGIEIKKRGDKGHLGIQGLAYSFDTRMERSWRPDNQFAFSGKKGANASVFYQLALSRINLQGESAIDHGGGLAHLHGLHVQANSRLAFVSMLRHYERNYQSLHGNALSELSGLANESGWYWGIEFYPFARWKLSAYHDMFTHPWLRYQVNSPSGGNDMLLQADYRVNSSVKMYLRIKHKQKLANSSREDHLIDYSAAYTRTNTRFHISYQLSRQLSMNNRVELNSIETGTKKPSGYLVYHDITWTGDQTRISARYCLFDIDHYDARIYTHEHDVLHGYSMPFFYKTGNRYYLLIKHSLSRRVDGWFKISRTRHSGATTMGSGSRLIDGNKVTEIKFQLRYKF